MPPPRHLSSSYDPKHDPYYVAVGRIATSWADFEFAVNDSIWCLANAERRTGACITAQLIGPGPRFRCLVSLLNLRSVPKPLIDEFNTMSSDAAGLGSKRNRYLHDPIAAGPTDAAPSKLEVTADKILRFGFSPVDLKKMINLVNEIDALTDSLDDLFARVLVETPPWPRTQYEQSKGIRRVQREIDTAVSELERPPES